MQNFFKHYIKGDLAIWVIFLLLFLVSIVEIYSSGSYFVNNKENYMSELFRQGGFLVLGAAVAIIVHRLPFRFVRLSGYLLLTISVLLLLVLNFVPPASPNSDPLFGVIAENGAARWLAFLGIRFQPSELAKIALIICMADLLTVAPEKSFTLTAIARLRKRELTKQYADGLKFWVCFGLILLFCALVYRSNISTTVLIFTIGMAMLFFSNVSLSRFLITLLTVLCVGGGYVFYKTKASTPKTEQSALAGTRTETGKSRITNFLQETDENKYQIYRTENGQKKELYTGKLQVVEAQIAIARGGWLGVGPGNSVERDYLPQAYADFIYAIVLEEMGILGGFGLILLYLWLLMRAGKLAYRSKHHFPAFLVIGLALMIVVQAFISMGVAVHLGPVTGQPLPLISRGGTSIVITCLYLGIIQCVARNINETSPKPVLAEEKITTTEE